MLGMEKPPRLDLINMIRGFEDPQRDRTRSHNLVDILGIAICALWCGADSFEDMALVGECKKGWLGTFLELPNGIPSHDTFWARVCGLGSKEVP